MREGLEVVGAGRVVAVEGKPVRLCGDPLIFDAGFGKPDETACPADAVVLEGVDPAVLPVVPGGRAGTVSFRGIWQQNGVQVREQLDSLPQQAPGSGLVMDDTQVPCAEPPGGWPGRAEAPQEDYPASLLELGKQHPDDVLATAVLHPPPDQVVLGAVTISDEAAERVRSALSQDYGRGICVVASPYSAADYTDATSGGPRVLHASEPNFVTGLELRVSWRALVVDDPLQQRLAQLPEGLVEITALVRPA